MQLGPWKLEFRVCWMHKLGNGVAAVAAFLPNIRSLPYAYIAACLCSPRRLPITPRLSNAPLNSSRLVSAQSQLATRWASILQLPVCVCA